MAADRARLPYRGVVVAACGSTLRGDDGAGPAVAELLAAALEGTGAQVVVADQLLPELAHDIGEARLVVFVDAAADRPVGSVTVERVLLPHGAPGADGAGDPATHASPRRAPARDPFSHGMGAVDVLALARELYAATPEGLLVSIGAESFDAADELSGPVRDAVPRAYEAALRVIEQRMEKLPGGGA